MKKAPRGRPFQPGNQYGHGRPKGSPNKKVQSLVYLAPGIVPGYGERLDKLERQVAKLAHRLKKLKR